MKKNKKIKTKTPKSSFEKEQSFIKISTRLLIITVFIIAVIVAFNKTFGKIDLSNTETNSLSALSKLSNKVDTTKLISNQLSDTDKPALIEKIKASGLDILTNDEIDYEKYSLDSISINSDLNLNSNEVGLIYSYLFVNNTDKYNTVIYEISITKNNDTITLKTVASINFYNLFTSKLSGSQNDETIKSLPKRIYITNTTTYTNEVFSYSQAVFNNLTESESKEISNLIKNTNKTVDLNNYIPNLIIEMINNIATKTNTSFIFDDNSLTFKKDA